jgi:hypothetical protein
MGMLRRLAVGGAALGLFVLVVGYIAVGPVLTLNALREAIISHDTARIATLVDIPTLRACIKRQLIAFAQTNASAQSSSSFSVDKKFGGHAKLDALAQGMADTVVTPEAMIELATPAVSAQRPSAVHPGLADMFARTSLSIVDGSHARVALRLAARNEPLNLSLTRHGLAWKVSAVVLPNPRDFAFSSPAISPPTQSPPAQSTGPKTLPFSSDEAVVWEALCEKGLGRPSQCVCISSIAPARAVARSVMMAYAAHPGQSITISAAGLSEDEMVLGIPAFQHCLH